MSVRTLLARILFHGLLVAALLFAPTTILLADNGNAKQPGGNLVAKARGKSDSVTLEAPGNCRLILLYGSATDRAVETARRAAQSFQAKHGNTCLKVIWVRGDAGEVYISRFSARQTCPHCGGTDFTDQELSATAAALRTMLTDERNNENTSAARRRKIDRMLAQISESRLEGMSPAQKARQIRPVVRNISTDQIRSLRKTVRHDSARYACTNQTCLRSRFTWREYKGNLDSLLKRHDDGRKIKCYRQVLVIYHGDKKVNTTKMLRWIQTNINLPVNRLVLWSCYGSKQINAVSLNKYFEKQNNLRSKDKSKIPCQCQCIPEVYTAENLTLTDDLPQVIRPMIDAQKKRIAELDQRIRNRGANEDTISDMRTELGKMQQVEAWLKARLAKIKAKPESTARTTGLSMPLGINEDYATLVLQAPNRLFRRYTGDGQIENDLKKQSLFDGARIEINRELAILGILSEYEQLDQEGSGDTPTGAAADNKKKPAAGTDDPHTGKKQASSRTPEKIRKLIDDELAKRHHWQSQPESIERSASLRLINSAIDRLQRELNAAEAAEQAK